MIVLFILQMIELLYYGFGISTNVLTKLSISDNGNDAFQIINDSATLMDRFDVDSVDGDGTSWDHEDSYYYRKQMEDFYSQIYYCSCKFINGDVLSNTGG